MNPATETILEMAANLRCQHPDTYCGLHVTKVGHVELVFHCSTAMNAKSIHRHLGRDEAVVSFMADRRAPFYRMESSADGLEITCYVDADKPEFGIPRRVSTKI